MRLNLTYRQLKKIAKALNRIADTLDIMLLEQTGYKTKFVVDTINKTGSKGTSVTYIDRNRMEIIEIMRKAGYHTRADELEKEMG